ncbi:MAG TPA: tRNA uridine-5-carboxymethylaminomethyl(34) synthesis GTPase MnmE [Ferruginibacter sp.]|nr:tRNA uridine-5-carboxymethylaminomethyl(34) synthesis GTPase MnmE [Ferruginibacter sp.]
MTILSDWDDTIVALATPHGTGAIGVVRLSGPSALQITQKIFKGKNPEEQAGNTVHYGHLYMNHEWIDEVLITIFKKPHSYTGEDVVEISGHGSPYIIGRIIEACIDAGARLAKPGEYSQRAFLNGKMDLAQAEAVADLIAANSRAAQQTALQQLRGGYAKDLQWLRDELIQFAALIELELDFSEEDVEFADRTKLLDLVENLLQKVRTLIQSFALGNVIKEGVRVAIIGKPNAGKSTLLNALLNEERAIVSDIAGTTRDTIEETLNIEGVLFRLIDTAGIREHSTDIIEKKGMERSKENAAQADVIVYLIDLLNEGEAEEAFEDWLNTYKDKTLRVYNKYHAWKPGVETADMHHRLYIDAKDGYGIEALKQRIYEKAVGKKIQSEASIVTNARHIESLKKIEESVLAVQAGIEKKIPGDLLTIDIRRALHYLGEITGRVEIDRDILGTIFGKFCIGK